VLVDKCLPAVCWLLCCYDSIFESVQVLRNGAHCLPYLLFYLVLALLSQLSCKQQTESMKQASR
jgi:hypothetical protein